MAPAATPMDLEGQSIGPVVVAVTADRVALYVDTTGDDADRWLEEAPPGFGSVLLFAVADEFLYDPQIIPFTRTLLHLDQTFVYHSPIAMGATLTVAGEVTRVRQRADSYFVTFTANATDGDAAVVESVSTFVLSDQEAPPAEDVLSEPDVMERGVNSGGLRSASRHDLVRYSAATRDFNPLHWDHEFAVNAGLPGTVVHGLLMYAWLMQQASTATGGATVAESKIRFRSALFPSQQAQIDATPEGETVRLSLAVGEDQLISGRATMAERV
ncbi:MAG: MaoC/PaaZ C-terminal domain-containing protein [Acidimicrobiia bacterium]